MKLETHNSSLCIVQSYFINDGLENFLIFQPVFHTFTIPAGLADAIVELEAKGLSNEKIPTSRLSSKLKWYNSRIRV